MFKAITIKTTLLKKLLVKQECQENRDLDIGEIVSLEKSNKNVIGLRILASFQSIFVFGNSLTTGPKSKRLFMACYLHTVKEIQAYVQKQCDEDDAARHEAIMGIITLFEQTMVAKEDQRKQYVE
nr:hypothetical protein [Tanacetum cinerariifolium]